MEIYFNALLLPTSPICETYLLITYVCECASLNYISLIFKSKTLCYMPPREMFQSQGNLKSILIFQAYVGFFFFN